MLNSETFVTTVSRDIISSSPVRRHHHRHNVKSRYEFIKTLGKGTYGKVKLARHKETNKLVAVKAIKKDKIKDSTDMKHIRREMEIMSTIQHQHIIQIYEVFENQEKIVIVMEYASGGELYDHLAEKRGITEEEAKSFFRQIVSAVRYCHHRGIVHRDLKLENILLDQDHRIKIADFGLANSFKPDSLLETFCGSPLYASPEIVCGVKYKGPEVDSWSLGVLLYALVYGTMPFDGTNYQVLTKQITSGSISIPSKTSEAHGLICWLLTVDPRRRASIEDIAKHEWMDFAAESVQATTDPSEDTLSYAQYLKDRLDVNYNVVSQEPIPEDAVVSSLSSQPKGILKPAATGKRQHRKSDADKIFEGQLAAVCGLHAKDSLKLKAKPQSASGKRRVLKSKRDRENGYYSSPERVHVIHERANSSAPVPHPNNRVSIPQIKSTLATPRLHTQQPMSSPRKSTGPVGIPREHYLQPITPGADERPSSDEGSSADVHTRPASTYSDSSILSTDSFDLCSFDGYIPQHVNGVLSHGSQTPDSISPPRLYPVQPDNLPPLDPTTLEDQPPGTLTPNSEKLVRDLQRILAPSGRRRKAQTHENSHNPPIHRPQSLDETTELSRMMNQLNCDLDQAYKKATVDIYANIKSEV